MLERIYRRYGSDLRFVAKTCMELAPRKERLEVLDVGCSTGNLIRAFFRHGGGRADVTGLDIDPGAARNAPSDLRDKIVTGDFLTLDLDRRFDIITMKFLVEHLLDFNAYVARARSLLAPGGVLFISTPDIDSPMAVQQGAQWHSLNSQEQRIGHIVWFNRASLYRLAALHGLSVQRCTNRGAFFFHLPLPMQRTLLHILGREPTSGRVIRSDTLRLLAAAFGDGWLSEKLDYGDSLYAFMTRMETQ